MTKPKIASIPTTIDLTQDWLVDYWSGELGVSRGRLAQAVDIVGPEATKLRKYLKDGHRIAIRDDTGVLRLVARITLENDGFAVSVPYHPAKKGWIWEIPIDYSKREYPAPLSEGKHYTVNDTVKLSMHMSGFVQFSRGGGKPIVSGYNPLLGQIKGAGLKAPDPVNVTTGPLFGVILQGLGEFDMLTNKPAEVFELDDLWHHPEYSTPEDTAFNLEVFMFPRRMLAASRTDGAKRLLTTELPFNSKIRFAFDVRVIEIPHLPVFLGAILSHIERDESIESCYKIGGPGCGAPGEEKRSIAAWYPRPDLVDEFNVKSLDYRPPEEPSQ